MVGDYKGRTNRLPELMAHNILEYSFELLEC